MDKKFEEQRNTKLVKQLEAYIAERNWKNYQLANFLGTTEGNVSRWLLRKHTIGPAWRELLKIKLNLKD